MAGALLALPQSSFCASSSHPSHYVGTYQSATSKKPGPMMTLSLGSDGTATLTQDWGKGAKTWFGNWADQGGQITVTFQGVPGQPAEAPMTFHPGHGGLVAATWNHADWGKAVPPPMKKQNGNWHSGGDHHGFW